jgi:Ca2+:H+ antiporter
MAKKQPVHAGRVADLPARSPARSGVLSAAVLVPVAAAVLGAVLHALDAAQVAVALPLELAISVLVLGGVFWTVFVALRHAEAVAERVGEPYGTLVLTLSVTAIEVSVIVAVMLGGEPNPGVAREAVFSTVMIVCAGVVGICLTLGGWKHREQELKRQGTSALLAIIIALSVLTLVLPDFTLNGGGIFLTQQLALVGLLCFLLYAAFLVAQMTRHRLDFVEDAPELPVAHVEPERSLLGSLVLLLVALGGVVLLAEHVASTVEDGLEVLQVTQTDAIVGAFIATLVLMPETVAAMRAAMRNELQRSLNIALGSACATIGLTVPIVAAVSIFTGTPLVLGLAHGDIVLLTLALAVSMVSFGTGRTNVLTGLVHVVVFVAYLLLIVVP